MNGFGVVSSEASTTTGTMTKEGRREEETVARKVKRNDKTTLMIRGWHDSLNTGDYLCTTSKV